MRAEKNFNRHQVKLCLPQLRSKPTDLCMYWEVNYVQIDIAVNSNRVKLCHLPQLRQALTSAAITIQARRPQPKIYIIQLNSTLSSQERLSEVAVVSQPLLYSPLYPGVAYCSVLRLTLKYLQVPNPHRTHITCSTILHLYLDYGRASKFSKYVPFV